MKNPCDECLVQACCSAECWDKQNYTILVQSKASNFRHVSGNPAFRDEFYKTMKIQTENSIDLMKIERRSKGKKL